MPNPNYDRLRSFFSASARVGVDFVGFRNDAGMQRSYRLNTPDIYRAVVQMVTISGVMATAVLCAEDNIVSMGPGPDRIALTADDIAEGSLLSTTRHTEQWVFESGIWMIENTVSYETLGQGALCV